MNTRKFSILLVAALLVSLIGSLRAPLPVLAASTLSFTPSSISFGNVYVGTMSTWKDVTIKNIGSVDVTLGKLTASANFKIKPGTCTQFLVLAPDTTCIFSVLFAPLSIAYLTGTANIPSDADNPLYTVPLAGYGIGTNLLAQAFFSYPFTKPIPWREGPNTLDINRLLDCSVWVSPICSIVMRGSSLNLNQFIWQSKAVVGEVGDTYVFILSSKAREVPVDGIYRMEVELLNTYNQRVGFKAVNFINGTHRWQTPVGTITATRQYIWLIFRFRLRKTSGTAWFDNAILAKLPRTGQ
jgi:hypothetical protein